MKHSGAVREGLGVAVGGLRCGYHPPAVLAGAVAAAGERNVAVSVALAAGDVALVFAPAGVAVWVAGVATWPVAVVVSVAAVFVMGRGLRGSECLVHEASHRTFSARAGLNDGLGDWLAAVPVFSRVAAFRASHVRHHNRFAVLRRAGFDSQFDPDRDRFKGLGMDRLVWGDRWQFAAGMLRCLPSYFVGWFVSIGSSPAVLATGLLWHGSLLSALVLTVGLKAALAVYGLWMVAFVVVLPVYRFVGEAQEHDYSAGDTQFATTISNTGALNWWIHPHGDGHHAEHHAFPTRPGFRLRRLAAALVVNDPQGWGQGHLHRRQLLQRPVRGHRQGPVNRGLGS